MTHSQSSSTHTGSSSLPNDHPARKLFNAIQRLCICLSNDAIFHELATNRNRKRDAELKAINSHAQWVWQEADRMRKNGEPVEAWIREQRADRFDEDRSPTPSEPLEFLRELDTMILRPGRTTCAEIWAALREGGARGLDAATSPNQAGQPRSIEIYTKTSDADGVFCGLQLGLNDSRVLLDDRVKAMRELCAWTQRLMNEMLAVFNTRGFDAPPVQSPPIGTNVLEELQSVAKAIPTELERQRAEIERVASVVESSATQGGPSPSDYKLPRLKPWAMEAWRAKQSGMTVTKIAEKLADKYDDPKITQPRVSEQINRAKKHAEASELAQIAAKVLPQVKNRSPARTLDPAAADLGQRTDGRSKHLREKARQIAKEE